MAKTRTASKQQVKAQEAPLTTKVANGTPYQLDPAQVERAATALVSHMKKHVEEKDQKEAIKNLADDEDEAEDNDQPIFLSVSTKKHVNNTNRLKPTKMSVHARNMRILVLIKETVLYLTRSSPATFAYAFSQRTPSARTRTLSHPTLSQLLYAKRSFAYLV
jgi:hypothetical protein